jgi:hypothetical protein
MTRKAVALLLVFHLCVACAGHDHPGADIDRGARVIARQACAQWWANGVGPASRALVLADQARQRSARWESLYRALATARDFSRELSNTGPRGRATSRSSINLRGRAIVGRIERQCDKAQR